MYEKEALQEIKTTLKENNAWANNASMIIAVFSKKDLDCNIGSREFYLFDTGMATAYMILRGTELGLVVHPIAGYSHSKTKKILEIPEEYTVITLLIVGKKSEDTSLLSENQITTERKRPSRKSINDFVHHNKFS